MVGCRKMEQAKWGWRRIEKSVYHSHIFADMQLHLSSDTSCGTWHKCNHVLRKKLLQEWNCVSIKMLGTLMQSKIMCPRCQFLMWGWIAYLSLYCDCCIFIKMKCRTVSCVYTCTYLYVYLFENVTLAACVWLYMYIDLYNYTLYLMYVCKRDCNFHFTFHVESWQRNSLDKWNWWQIHQVILDHFHEVLHVNVQVILIVKYLK